jgi:hypothetical protein
MPDGAGHAQLAVGGQHRQWMLLCGCWWLQTDPLRKFYTSLLAEKPDSAMALKW